MSKKYLTSCIKCGASEKPLMMVPHRVELDALVGFVYSCSDCFDLIAGEGLLVMFGSPDQLCCECGMIKEDNPHPPGAAKEREE